MHRRTLIVNASLFSGLYFQQFSVNLAEKVSKVIFPIVFYITDPKEEDQELILYLRFSIMVQIQHVPYDATFATEFFLGKNLFRLTYEHILENDLTGKSYQFCSFLKKLEKSYEFSIDKMYVMYKNTAQKSDTGTSPTIPNKVTSNVSLDM